MFQSGYRWNKLAQQRALLLELSAELRKILVETEQDLQTPLVVRHHAGSCTEGKRILHVIQAVIDEICPVLRRGGPSAIETGEQLLHELSTQICQLVDQEPPAHFYARWVFGRVRALLTVAQQYLVDGRQASPYHPSQPTLLLSTDILFQAYQSLFPPERMLLAAGRVAESTITVGALFDVTGDAGIGHVRADGYKLGNALIAMEHSRTQVALWIHSHPGTGPDATRPSPIDTRQHTDWLRHYSPNLVGIIVVKDGWIRCWGTAIETANLNVELLGAGVSQYEADDGILYRLDT